MTAPPSRRRFFKVCLSAATMAAANPARIAPANTPTRAYNRVLLTDTADQPITSHFLKAQPFYLFHYPYISTPCFLIDMGRPVVREHPLASVDNGAYYWPGGTGPNRSVVAFSAICAHRLSYPTRTTSFINFRPERMTYTNHNRENSTQAQLIYCCSERSVYDPANGGEVLGGPAPQPLTTIIIDYDADTDHYHAHATTGGELYTQFFAQFGFRLVLDHGHDDIRALAETTTPVYTPQEYTNHRVQC